MIRPTAVLICESVIQDRTTNKMSIINLLEQVIPAGYPLFIQRLAIFVMFEREEGDPAESQALVEIVLDTETVHTIPVDVNFGETLLNRNVVRFEGLIVPRPGIIKARATVGNSRMESYSLQAFPSANISVEVEGS